MKAKLPLSVSIPAYCRELGLPEPVAEYRPIPGRRYRIDFAWPRDMTEPQFAVHAIIGGVGLEIDGGMFTGGRHGGAPSAIRDLTKRNELTARGWLIIHVPPSQLWRAQTWEWLRTLLT